MKWFAIIMLAIIVEGVVEYFKLAFSRFADSQFVIPATIVLGVSVAILYGCDILEVFGLVTPVPYVGNVLSGIIVARGSNYVYDLIGKSTDAKEYLGDPYDGEGE